MVPTSLKVGGALTIPPEIFHHRSLPPVEYVFLRGVKGEKPHTQKTRLKKAQSYFTEIKAE